MIPTKVEFDPDPGLQGWWIIQMRSLSRNVQKPLFSARTKVDAFCKYNNPRLDRSMHLAIEAKHVEDAYYKEGKMWLWRSMHLAKQAKCVDSTR